MGKIAGWKIVKQNTKEIVYKHKEPFVSPSGVGLKGSKTTAVRILKITSKRKISGVSRKVGKNKWVFYTHTIEPPTIDGPGLVRYGPHVGSDHSSKQCATDAALKWMRKHPHGAPKMKWRQ